MSGFNFNYTAGYSAPQGAGRHLPEPSPTPAPRYGSSDQSYGGQHIHEQDSIFRADSDTDIDRPGTSEHGDHSGLMTNHGGRVVRRAMQNATMLNTGDHARAGRRQHGGVMVSHDPRGGRLAGQNAETEGMQGSTRRSTSASRPEFSIRRRTGASARSARTRVAGPSRSTLVSNDTERDLISQDADPVQTALERMMVRMRSDQATRNDEMPNVPPGSQARTPHGSIREAAKNTQQHEDVHASRISPLPMPYWHNWPDDPTLGEIAWAGAGRNGDRTSSVLHGLGGTSRSEISRLPTRQIVESDRDEDGEVSCSICLLNVPVGDSVTVMPCSHWYHTDCLSEWLVNHRTCPTCRVPLPASSARS